MVKVVGLHDHIVEFQKAQALFHALLVALGPQHVVDGEAGAHLPQQFHVVQLQQPIRIVEHPGLPLAEFDKALHLLFEAIAVVLDGLGRHHGAHIASAGGVSNHSGTAADQGDGPVARHLQPLHQAQGHEVAYVKGIRSGIEADIEYRLARIDHFRDLFLIGDLGDQPPGLEFFITSHVHFVPLV